MDFALSRFYALSSFSADEWDQAMSELGYQDLNGNWQMVDSGTSRTIVVGTNSYPPPFLSMSTPAQLVAAGFYPVVDPGASPPAGSVTTGFVLSFDGSHVNVLWQYRALTSGEIIANASQALKSAALTALAAGCQIVSTGTPGVNGIYALDPASIADVMAEVQFISAYSQFSNGASTLVWPLVSGAVTFPSTVVAMGVFKGLAQYVTGWKQYASGLTATPPSQPFLIP